MKEKQGGGQPQRKTRIDSESYRKHLIIFAIILLYLALRLFTSCAPELPESYKQTQDQTHQAKATPVMDSRPVDMIWFGDESSSGQDNSILELKPEDFEQPIQLVLQHGGRLTVCMINSVSKDNMVSFSVDVDPRKSPPIQQRGEAPAVYMKRLQKYQQQVQQYIPDTEEDERKAEVFRSELKKILKYRRNTYTNLGAAITLSNILLEEQLDDSALKVVVMATDGIAYESDQLPNNCSADQFIMVTRSEEAFHLSKYDPKIVATPEAAIKIIKSKL